jgi:hypothetical protein
VVSTGPVDLEQIDLTNFVDPKTREVQTPRPDVSLGFDPQGFLNPQPEFNGTRFKDPNSAAVFLVDQGFRRLIVNAQTYNALFRDWDGIVTGTGAEALMQFLPDGAQINGDALVNGDTVPVYLLDVGTKRRIANSHTMDVYHFKWAAIYKVPQIAINSIPDGSTISA